MVARMAKFTAKSQSLLTQKCSQMDGSNGCPTYLLSACFKQRKYENEMQKYFEKTSCYQLITCNQIISCYQITCWLIKLFHIFPFSHLPTYVLCFFSLFKLMKLFFLEKSKINVHVSQLTVSKPNTEISL
jgi:hypothetical protein